MQMRYSARRQVPHDPACHGVMGQYWGGFPLPSSGSWLGSVNLSIYTSLAENLATRHEKGEVDLWQLWSDLDLNYSLVGISVISIMVFRSDASNLEWVRGLQRPTPESLVESYHRTATDVTAWENFITKTVGPSGRLTDREGGNGHLIYFRRFIMPAATEKPRTTWLPT